ncbi:MAG TPA: tRNA glutamyl-Q(34) synthetase GluQRS [Polyangiaceae bacterium]|nr:tRNA glutamyl-Q(34) synthetase GluQRS [Polyangiaceae bacterium]
MIRTRFAPSPTGELHLGGAWTALASWVIARRRSGECLLRLEDLDAPRVVSGAERRITEDLRWLGFDWDAAPVRQSERRPFYESAIERLTAGGLTYPCDCSRAEIASVASAPHEGEELVYPGTCRERDPNRRMKRPPSLRIRVPDAVVQYEDAILGPVAQNLSKQVGDFVLCRGDGVFAYQLAVVVDDLQMRITDVIRGSDLVGSTPRQIWLARALGATPPRYGHVPLVVTDDGKRLEKRSSGITIAGLRASGVGPEAVVGALAHGLGLAQTPAPATPPQIAAASASDHVRWRRAPWPTPASW